ncbi:unnamed protein product, partial [Choristocarpus tenellus]
LLLETPRNDKATEAVAAAIDRRLVASESTYTRLVEDRIAIGTLYKKDLPYFRNPWHGGTWIGEVEVTFNSTMTLVYFGEGGDPDYYCMMEMYG